MLYTGPGAAALIGRRGRNLTVITQARFAFLADRTERPLHGNESGTAGTAILNLLPSLKGLSPLGDGLFYASPKREPNALKEAVLL